MKKLLLIALWGMLFICRSHSQSGYYYGKEFIELKPDYNESVFIISNDKQSEIAKLYKKSSSNILKIAANQYLANRNTVSLDSNLYISEIYVNKYLSHSVVLPKIALKLVDEFALKEILKKYPELSFNKKLSKSPVFCLNCSTNHSKKVLDLVSIIGRMQEVVWCEPILISDYHTSNPLYHLQYYLKNTGANGGGAGIDINVESAWEITNGNSNITVAVIDEGIDDYHEDLLGNVISGYTAGYPNGHGEPQNEDNSCEKAHGVACSGIIGAQNNNIGIRGVASGVKLIPVNIFPYSPTFFNPNGAASNDEIADAITWAYSHADILSCSWGGGSYSNLIESAITDARTYGRNGKGCIVVFSSGNLYDSPGHQNDTSFPSNVDGVITVGAIDRQGNICSYSQRGPSLDLVAPSGSSNNPDVVTTDRMGNSGYNTNSNYTYTFGGTSAACPQVAGTAALLLSIRPDLTEVEVKNALYSTARDLGPVGRDDTFGHGLVNAYAALKEILTPKEISGPSTICDSTLFSISCLSEIYNISWSINNTAFTISPNDSVCYVSYNLSPRYDVATLTATVSRNGQTVTTLSKRIVMHGSALSVQGRQNEVTSENGVYPERVFTIPDELEAEPIEELPLDGDGNIIHPSPNDSLLIPEEPEWLFDPTVPVITTTDINGGNVVRLESNRFDGMEISFSGSYPPMFCQHNNTGVYFKMPYCNEAYPTTLHARSAEGCHDFDLPFNVVPLTNDVNGDPEIWINLSGTSLTITFSDLQAEELPSGEIILPSWNLAIYNMQTGILKYSSTVYNNNSATVNISNWPQGIYIIRVGYGNNSYSKKFTL